MRPETEQLYQRGDRYDALFGPQVHPFWQEVADAYGSPILELTCGTGRIAIPLAQAGHTVTGLDGSPYMLAEAQRKAEAAGVHVDWVEGDMRAFTLATRYSLVILPANALCHLLTRADFTACMRCVQAVLRPGGRFVVEVFVPDLRLLLYQPEERHSFGEYDDPDGRGHVVVTYSASYDPATQIRHSRTYSRFPDQAEEEVGELPMRMYFPQELDALFACHGFTLEHKYGDLDRRPFDAASKTQVCILGQDRKG